MVLVILQVVCTLVNSTTASALLAETGIFSLLLKTAVFPTELEEFKSLTQLEDREQRLLELLYQHKVLSQMIYPKSEKLKRPKR